MTNNNNSMQGGPMKPMPHPYRPIPGEAEYCQKSGHTGHYRRTAHKEWPAGHYGKDLHVGKDRDHA